MPNSISQTLTRHQIFIQRYGGSEFKKLTPVLRQMLKDIKTTMQNAPPNQVTRLMQIETEIRLIIGNAAGKISQKLLQSANDLIKYESGFTNRFLDGFMTVKSAGVDLYQLQAVVTAAPMKLLKGSSFNNQTIEQAINHFAGTIENDILQKVRMGIVSGQTTPEITKQIASQIQTRTVKQAEALARTTINHVASETRNQVIKENSNLFDGERFVATLDGRTTVTCAGFDGQKFDVGEGPMPPLHWNCRSTRIPLVKESLRIPGFTMERASMTGPVDAKETYGGFLKRQSKEFQNEVLGPKRAALFRSGKVSISNFTDDNGRVLTLKQLAEKENLVL